MILFWVFPKSSLADGVAGGGGGFVCPNDNIGTSNMDSNICFIEIFIKIEN
jgi:hypothetical protein